MIQSIKVDEVSSSMRQYRVLNRKKHQRGQPYQNRQLNKSTISFAQRDATAEMTA